MEIRELEQGNTYKYLGIKESDEIESKMMKEEIKKRIKSKLES